MIEPGADFKENLGLLPAIDGVARIELVDGAGAVVATIENAPGKQGSLKVYQYLQQEFGALNVAAAEHGLLVFGEHTEDACNNPGAHPNIDRLIDVVSSGDALTINVIAA
ncbi:DUF2322 family protein [Devosia sp. MC521]|uniref:DUF2322 family protein n=1 Tax=Devosia sp. MC521 TaxID=2759954 RepID=UPI0015F7A9E3|nr:DUF2322 family protein [Devosia sp. MC521]MBJ6987404.1 DUF2322 family protein [Devosia sp. MC521]QMW63572.1 DUF2322 family protein [Devosia sp. MC521]